MPYPPQPAAKWRVLALLFFATTINYLDRIVFSVLIPMIRKDIPLTDQDYGNLISAFQICYTFGFLVAGKFIDRFGTRAGYAASVVWWSIAAAMHAFAHTPLGLAFWRGMLGFGEAGNFPAAIKAVAEWYPKKDRAFATGAFNGGTTVASIAGPPVFVWLYASYGWRMSFLATASLGVIWVLLWLMVYRNPGGQERDVEETAVTWMQALRLRETWGFATAKFLTDPVWWFYLFWLPPYLYDVRHFAMADIAWALPAVYMMATAGSLLGGWMSGHLIGRGWRVAAARKFSMFVFAACMPLAAMAVFAPNPVLTIALIGLATAAHQGWSANLYTTTSDYFPKNAVASVTGIGGSAGGIGGVLFSAVIPGFVVTHFGYTPLFLAMGAMHLAAWGILRLMLLDEKRPSYVEASART